MPSVPSPGFPGFPTSPGRAARPAWQTASSEYGEQNPPADTLEEQGILTRCFGGVWLENCIRFSIGLPEEDDILMDALKKLA